MEIVQAVPMLEESSLCQSGIVQLRNSSLLASILNWHVILEIPHALWDNISAMHRLPGRFRALAYSRGADLLAVSLRERLRASDALSGGRRRGRRWRRTHVTALHSEGARPVRVACGLLRCGRRCWWPTGTRRCATTHSTNSTRWADSGATSRSRR